MSFKGVELLLSTTDVSDALVEVDSFVIGVSKTKRRLTFPLPPPSLRLGVEPGKISFIISSADTTTGISFDTDASGKHSINENVSQFSSGW